MHRQQRISAWLATLFPGRSIGLTAASADASFRRYFRADLGAGETRVVMDAPPEREDCRPWLHVRQLFAAAGVHVPAVEAQDLEQGFLLLSDLGDTTYLAALAAESTQAAEVADALYREAIDALVRIQSASRPGQLPDYDRALLKRELDLFPEWYVARHHGLELADTERQALEAVFERLLAVNLAESRVFVHRDFHSRNLMRIAGGAGANPGIIDFQDAVYGPVSYDMASLLKDAYVDWDEAQALDWLARYWERARKAGVPVRDDFADFHRDYEWMGVQRHVKVLGIFARLWHRDGKDGYLKDMPRVANYLRAACERYRDLMPLLRLLDRLENRQAQAGFTF